MRRWLLRGMLAVLLAGIGLPGAASAWWNEDWSLRKPVTVEAGAGGGAIATPIGRSPVLVRLHPGNFKFDAAKPDGSDLRVIAADDRTPLGFEIEKFDSLLGEAFLWVDLPDLAPGASTGFTLYYGNPKAPALPAGHAFDADTVLVYHFAEHGAPARDSSAFANNAQSVAPSIDGALIGPGLRLTGAAPLTLPGSPSLAWGEDQALTWSAWVKPAALAANAAIYRRSDGGNGLVIGLDQGAPYVEVTRAGQTARSAAAPAIAAQSWHHLAVVAQAGAVTLFLDGAAVGSVAAALPALTGPATLGGEPAATGFVGELDELEIAKVARPAGFLRLAALGQGPDGAKLVRLGPDEETSSWSGGYFAVILHSVTLDGWVVISILLLMSVASWAIMVDRARLLGRTERANQRFRAAFRAAAGDLTLLDGGTAAAARLAGGAEGAAALAASPLYRITCIAAEELKHRAGGGARPRPLSAEALAAIRAALDAGQVREIQRLNRMMVLLTLAISGGPFLGLLGTVVGVMITFAAIAASGDVNVNAIAPGIAAALVATVAGLFVAIPALFGYNWLISRIKDVSADLQVFVDELVTRTAEAYHHRADRHAEQVRPAVAE